MRPRDSEAALGEDISTRNRMSDMQFNCSECGKGIDANQKHSGMVIRCPECGERTLVPTSTIPESPDTGTPSKTPPIHTSIRIATLCGYASACLSVCVFLMLVHSEASAWMSMYVSLIIVWVWLAGTVFSIASFWIQEIPDKRKIRLLLLNQACIIIFVTTTVAFMFREKILRVGPFLAIIGIIVFLFIRDKSLGQAEEKDQEPIETKPPIMVPAPKTENCPYCAGEILLEAIECTHCGKMLDRRGQSTPILAGPIIATTAKNRVTYILLGMFLGLLGIHNFYAGYKGRGVTQIVLTLSGIGGLIVCVWIVIELITTTADANGNIMT